MAILAFISAIVFCRRKDFSLDFSKLLTCGYCCGENSGEKACKDGTDDCSPSSKKESSTNKGSFFKKSNKVGALDTYPNAGSVTVNILKDSSQNDSKNTNEDVMLFHKVNHQQNMNENRNIHNLRTPSSNNRSFPCSETNGSVPY